MKYKLYFFLSLLIISTSLKSQNCINSRFPAEIDSGFILNDQSKTVKCESDKNYTLYITLIKGKTYRLSFYADEVFNKNLQFSITDKTKNTTFLNLPGKNETNKKGEVVLIPYEENGKSVHPFFDFYPANSAPLEVKINVGKNDKGKKVNGCLKMLVLTKKN